MAGGSLDSADDGFDSNDVCFSGGVGEYAVVPYLAEAWWEDVGTETVDEVFDSNGGDLLF